MSKLFFRESGRLKVLRRLLRHLRDFSTVQVAFKVVHTASCVSTVQVVSMMSKGFSECPASVQNVQTASRVSAWHVSFSSDFMGVQLASSVQVAFMGSRWLHQCSGSIVVFM